MKTNEKSLDFVKNLIKSTNLTDIVKNNMLERIDCLCDYEEIEEDDTLFVELDTCIELYEVLTGQLAFLNGEEKEDVESVVKNYFKNTLTKFPYNISTEDYILLYKKLS